MFTDKLTLAIAEAAKKCMDEDLVGNQHKIDANKNGKIDAEDFKKLRKEELKGNQHKIDANKNGKIDADDFKKLRKEESVQEESSLTYVAHSHDGRKANIEAGSSYEAHRKAIKHFDAPKAKHHMVHVKLAKKGDKDVVHTATESVQEAAIDDLRDRQAAAREANPYKSQDKKEPTVRKVQGSNYGGSKQNHEKEVEESVQLDELSKATLGSYVNKSVEDRVQRLVMSKPKTGKEAVSNMNKNIKRAEGQKLAISKLAKEEVEVLDESKAHIEQHLADRDINAKVTGKTVKVHSSDVASATKHVKMAGYKDHKVVGGLNEEKMSDEDMAQREKIVKGMKKNLKGFKARYGDDAERVMYATATKQAMKEEKKDKYDEGEYDREGDMAKSDLRSIIANAQKLHDMIEDADNLPEWVQSKITKSEDYISTVANYMTSEMSEEVEQIDELSKNTLGSYVKKAEADRDDSIKRYNSDERDAQGNKIRDKDLSPARKAIDKMMFKRSDKRIAGLKTANAKLAKEEVEQIYEMTRDEWDKQAEKTRKISDKNASEETIHDALSSNYHEHRRLAAAHPKANSEHLHRALKDESRHTREEAIRHPNATPEHIDKGLDDKEEWNRMKAAKHPNASKQNLDKALRDKDHSVRANAASHPNATSEHLHKAMDDNNSEVRLAAVKNPNATKEHLAKAVYSHSVAVRQAARKHPNHPDNKLTKEEVEELDEISKATLGSYVKKAGKQATKFEVDFEKGRDKGTYNFSSLDKAGKRQVGISKAVDKLTKEEVTNDQFKAELEDNKAKAAGTKKQPDVHKAAVQSVKQESFSEKLSMLKENARSFLKGKNNG
jgi:hypothetical protein